MLDESIASSTASSSPTCKDSCRNRRRDFHMQYELALPERIYPGPYKIELTITDHNSGKIGQATLAFEIAGDAPPKSRRPLHRADKNSPAILAGLFRGRWR